MFIDSHAHLDSAEFINDRDEVIKNCGLLYILNVTTDTESLPLSLELADKYDFIFIAAGIHPHNVADVDFDKFRKYLTHPKIKAIGETGLDFYKSHTPRELQEDVFTKCLAEAAERNLPVVIHQRNAEEEVLRILKNFSLKGVMHCFGGTKDYAKRCIDMGFYISFAGNITFPKADILRETAAWIPLENLLIETDCPWLAPQAVRGKRNEPRYVKYVAEEISKIKGVPLEEVARITKENFRKLFNIL